MQYKSLFSIQVRQFKEKQRNFYPVTILQLSDYSDIKQQEITSFFISLIWSEINHIKDEKTFDMILVDEFQKIKISKESSILQILKEGRKFDFGVILSSQFIAHYDSDILLVLLQCATNLFFHPIGKDATAIVKQLSVENPKAWELLLKNLKLGKRFYVEVIVSITIQKSSILLSGLRL